MDGLEELIKPPKIHASGTEKSLRQPASGESCALADRARLPKHKIERTPGLPSISAVVWCSAQP